MGPPTTSLNPTKYPPFSKSPPHSPAQPSRTTTKKPAHPSQTPTPTTSLLIVYIYTFDYHHSPPPSFSLPVIHERRTSDTSYVTNHAQRHYLYNSILREQLETRKFTDGSPIKSNVVVLVGARHAEEVADRSFLMVDGMRSFGVVPKWGNGVQDLVTGQNWADWRIESFWCGCGKCERCKTGRTANEREWENVHGLGLGEGPGKGSRRDLGRLKWWMFL